MSRWFRFYEGALDDPKVQRLAPELFKAWVNILCIASRGDGILPPIEDIAFALRLPEARASAYIKSLQMHGLLDEAEDGYTPHNWNGRQHKSDDSAERVKRHRQRKRNEPCNGDVTVTVTPPEQSRAEQSSEANASADPSEDERQLFARGKQVLGPSAGGLIAQLLSAKGKNAALARAAIEQASTKENPREFIAAIINDKPRGTHGKARSVQDVARAYEERLFGADLAH